MTAPHDETCARCDRRICVCGCQCATCVPVRPRGENAAREPWVPPADIDPAIRFRWPGGEDLNATARPAHADAVMADLGAAITEGVTETRLREVLARRLAWFTDAELADELARRAALGGAG